MVGVGVAPPSAAGVVARLAVRWVRIRRVSAKRSWPPGCGRLPVPPPPAPEVAGDGVKGADGRADEAVASAAVPPAAQNVVLHEQGQDKVEMPVSPAVVSPTAQNDSLPVQQGQDKAEEAVTLATVSSVECNSILQHPAPQQGPEQVEEEGDIVENGEVRLLFNGTDTISVDGHEGNRRAQVAVHVVGVLESNIVGASSSAHNGSEGAGLLLVAEERGVSGHVVRDEAAGDADGREIGNRPGGGELERKVDEVEGSKKRWLTSALNPLPKRRAVSGGAANEKVEGKRVVEKGSTKKHNKIQESRVASDTSQADAVIKASPKHGFTKKMEGDISQREGKQVAQVAVDEKVRSKLDASLQKEVFKTPMTHAIDANTKGKRFNSDKMNAMRKKTMSTENISQFSTESKYGKHITSNRIEENDDMDPVPNRIIVQALMAPDKCLWKKGRKSIASASKSVAPRKKLKGKDSRSRKQHPWKLASPKLGNDETINDNEDSYHKDDDNTRTIVVYGENKAKMEFNVNLPPSVPSSSHHRQPGDSEVDDRRKVRKLLQKFQAVCRKLMQVEEQHLRNIGRIDLEAISVIKKDPMYTKLEPIVGNVPGVEVGDEFHFRVELSLVGLHRPPQAGIDTTNVNGTLVAISVVASGGYPDELSSSDELIYTGSGGKASGKKDAEDQKLKRGNLALKNCIETKTPVRVIHGFKGRSRGEVAHSKGKQVSTFTYDGFYNVVAWWQEGAKGSMVFKYKLQRIPGQPQLALHVVKMVKKLKVREGLLLPDISHGSERMRICVINTVDGSWPTPFKYVTKITYPPWYKKEPPAHCDCTNGCSDSVKCACVVKNGGEIPYNFNGAIVEAKPLIYECGPSCRCPPTCHNRVSQHGVKIPLEIFRTGNTGWGVRSLSSISSGSFICEYVGELLEDEEAEKRENDEYLFDIGHNYQDKELWEGLKSIPGLESSTPSSKTMEGFTIDAAECGNVGRFINHSCSPNLYAQNVLWDHDDVQKPHVMFFAVENIPPLQELTYHYNYTIGQVQDKNGEEKVKHCYCGSSECCGRLY